MVMQKFDAIKNSQFLPKCFVCGAEIVNAGADGMRAGCGVDDDRIFSVLRPRPHLSEGIMQTELIGLFVSFGSEGHAAAMTCHVIGD